MEKVLKAAAYGRVSTNSRAQQHSFKNQSEYWNRMLGNNPCYNYIGLFADQGISGKSLKYRPQMLALLDLCKKGEVDIIFTKSVQRFARNTTELLEVVRELREKKIAVVFEKEGINTLENTSDMYLTIAAMVAEEDLNRYGANVAWAIEDSFKKGDLTVIGIRLFGYMTVNKELRIVPEEAKAVKKIFEMYASDKYSASEIARYLNGQGIKTTNGCKWKSSQVMVTIRNEKYKGEVLLHKYINEKGVTKKNKGKKDQYYVENSHAPIVSKELWEKANQVADRRSNKKLAEKEQPEYPFTGLIKCEKCGKNYLHKINNSGTPWATPIWKCHTHLQHGKATCSNSGIKDIVLKEHFINAFNEFIDEARFGKEDGALQSAINKLNQEEQELIALKVQGLIRKGDFEIDRAEIVSKRQKLEKDLRAYRRANITNDTAKRLQKFDEEMVRRVLKCIAINNYMVTFEFYNGVKISQAYTNGKPGNQTGWLDKKREKEAINNGNGL